MKLRPLRAFSLINRPRKSKSFRHQRHGEERNLIGRRPHDAPKIPSMAHHRRHRSNAPGKYAWPLNEGDYAKSSQATRSGARQGIAARLRLLSRLARGGRRRPLKNHHCARREKASKAKHRGCLKPAGLDIIALNSSHRILEGETTTQHQARERNIKALARDT